MPHHTLAWTADLVTATLTELTPVPDQIISVTNARFMPPTDMLMLAGIGYGTNLQRVRLTTPRLRQVSPVFLRPIQASLIGANDANSFFYDRNPLKLRGQEEIVMEAIQNAGVNQRITVLAHLSDRLMSPPPGDVYVVRATATTTLVVNTWTAVTYTLDNVLPAGRYAVLLVEGQSANAQGIRCTFDQQYWRPGAPGLNSVLSRLPYQYYEYFLGVWGYFHTFTLPRIEMLANVADTAEELYFHVVPMAA